jgi:Highly conserved protein containing a thioredoxin domain
MTKSVEPNRLILEKSPYLLQHTNNPVDWYPWGDEAFNKAKAEDKPIFLSIGYSTCHWCHVMERESFEDMEVAEALNKNYVSIKVDREERPDIDSIYMNVCHVLTGSGGWPLTIIMSPEKKPFFAGTYFPKNGRYSRPGLIDILNGVREAWDKNRDKINKSSEEIIRAVVHQSRADDKAEIDMYIVHEAYNDFHSIFDFEYGGFGNSPKFPTPHNLALLLRYHITQNSNDALVMVEKTLESMYKGGIFDHIGYGFSRYSTDRRWLVPHFEKMLYDNALLSWVSLEAYQITRRNLYREIAEKIFSYVLRDMTSDEGGFYSAEDADSEGVEGKFYVWEEDEVKSILGQEGGELYCSYYDITRGGNFEGKNIPNLINGDIESIEQDGQLKDRLHSLNKKLYQVREKRVHPFRDDKILTAWNGLMIASLSYGGRVLNNNEYVNAAKRAAGFILYRMVDSNGRLMARYRDGESANPGYIDDYAFLIHGLIELYEATFDVDILLKALKLKDEMVRLFWDDEHGGFYLYGEDSERLISRPKEIYDGAMPSGNSMAALSMIRLSRLTGKHELEDRVKSMFEAFGGNISANPASYSMFLISLMYSLGTSEDIVITGEKGDSSTEEMLYEINKRFLPFATVLLNSGDERLFNIAPYLKDQKMKGERATAYICRGRSCSEPINVLSRFTEVIDENN